MRRSPLAGSKSANLSDELPALNTSTKLPAAGWSELAAVVDVLGMPIGTSERLVPNVLLADLVEAGPLPVGYDSHCCRDLGFPVTGDFYGEVSSSACWLA
jgi:hypothetical protein